MFITLMGNGGTGEVGYVVHADLQAALAARSARTPEEAVGTGWEAVSRMPLEALHPLDGDRLASLGLLPKGGEVFVPSRIGPQGQQRPHQPLSTHALLLRALAEGVTSREGAVDAPAGEAAVSLAWPVESPANAKAPKRGRRGTSHPRRAR